MPTVTEKSPPQNAVWDQNGRRFWRAWDVEAESEQDAWDKLYDNTDPPVARGTVYVNHQSAQPEDFCVCQRMTARGHPPAPVDGTGLYEVVAEFAITTARFTPGAQYGGPTQWRVERTRATEPVDMDVAGNPITNSADEPIDPPLTRLIHTKVLIGEWFLLGRDWPSAYRRYAGYEGKLNSSAFHGAPPGSFWLDTVEPDQIYTVANGASEPRQKVFRCIGRWLYRPEKTLYGVTYQGWIDAFIDRGRRTIGTPVGGVRKYDPILMTDGSPISEPRLLNGAGGELAQSSNPVVRSVRHDDYAEFNALPEWQSNQG